jgi:serine/threonine protein kinase
MTAGEQEHKAPLGSEASRPEPLTQTFGDKQLETLPTAAQPAAEEGSSATVDAFVPGCLLGQYRILQRLGGGGMGQVYKAIHPVMDRVVALKVISPRLMKDDSARARFQREVRNAARLLHPNIVVAHDAAEVGEHWFLVMEYIDGRDLSQLLAERGRPPLDLACEIIRQAAVGLQYAYDCGMVHRDIKPANLIVANARPLTPPSPPPGREGRGEGAASGAGWPEDPLVKILDFGLARLIAPDGTGLVRGDGVTREGYVVGTPEYMAPEQARDSGRVDIRSDIYSLGCTLYALLAGRPPFRALSAFDLAVMHLNHQPEPVANYCPGVPAELSAIVHRMLAKRPEDRFATPGEVVSALQPWARRSSPASNPPPTKPAGDTASPPAPARPAGAASLSQQPSMPPDVLMMHFQAMLRTIVIICLIALIGIGCVLYLPDIGNHLLTFWNRMTPTTSRTAPSR